MDSQPGSASAPDKEWGQIYVPGVALGVPYLTALPVHLAATRSIVGLLLVGMLLRSYRLDGQKLWIDELFTAELVSSGQTALWKTVHALSPFAALPFWAAVQVVDLSAFSLRWVSVAASMLALALFCRYCMEILDSVGAITAAGFMAISPLVIYYAQEARPYALGLLGSVLTLFMYQRLVRRPCQSNSILYALAALFASHMYYLNMLLVGIQLIVLVFVEHRRPSVMVWAILVGVSILLSIWPFLSDFYFVVSLWPYTGATLDLYSALATLVSADVRIAPAFVRAVALAVIITGVGLAIMDRRNWRILIPHGLQIGSALLVCFWMLPHIGHPAPYYDERAFLMLLPSVLVLFGMGVQWLFRQKTGRLPALGLTAALMMTSSVSLYQYFVNFHKSPEGELVAAFERHIENGDMILTHADAYKVDAALQFYQPQLRVLRYRYTANDHWFFVERPSVLRFYAETEAQVELRHLTWAARLWLIYQDRDMPYWSFLQTDYQIQAEYVVAPFKVHLLTRRE